MDLIDLSFFYYNKIVFHRTYSFICTVLRKKSRLAIAYPSLVLDLAVDKLR